MSYSAIPRSNYLTFQPETPFENGSVGWSKAPYVGWGMNPNQMLPYELAGLGASCPACPPSPTVGLQAVVKSKPKKKHAGYHWYMPWTAFNGLGEEVAPTPETPPPPAPPAGTLPMWPAFAGYALAAAVAYGIYRLSKD